MKFFFSDLFDRKQRNQQLYEPAVVIHDESTHNITDGSEFLDDAIRMKEQPFMYPYTGESIAPVNPEDLS